MEGLIGQIIMWTGNFAPQNWAFCHGQSLTIQHNAALYSLIGVQFGGSGGTHFNLPNLQQQIITGAGGGVQVGQKSGANTTTLTADNIPAHNHAFMASTANGNITQPTGAYLATTGRNDVDYLKTGTPTTLAANAIGAHTGSSATPAAIDVRQPGLTLNFIICTQGMFPQRP